MSDFIRVPRAFKKRSKRSLLTIHSPSLAVDTSSASGSGVGTDMGRKSFMEKEKKSFKRGSVKERWLLTRKTWKFMTDAGRRLLPEGVGNKVEDIPKIEKYFQEVCRNEPRFLVWRRKCSYPGAGPLPRRRWKRRAGTVSAKTASSADEAEDEYNDTLEQVQYEQLMIDMLKKYLDIKDEDEYDNESEQDTRKSQTSILTSKSMVSLCAPISSTSTTATGNIKSSISSKYSSGSTMCSSAAGNSSGINDPKAMRGYMHMRSQNPANTTFSFPAQYLANMRRFGRGSSLIDHIPSDILNDKVALRMLYDQLKTTQKLNRLVYRIPNPKPQYQRSDLGLHKTFAFPELTGKPRGYLKSLHKTSDGSASELLLRFSDASLCGIDERSSTDSRPARKIEYHTLDIQTDRIPLPVLNDILSDYKKQLEHEEAMLREEEMAQLDDLPAGAARNNDRRNSEDVSQSVSDTIKRYLRMARKKPPKDDVNRFKRINYDRNLRNIKAKGEITKIGDDDGNCKGCQTDDDWIVRSFSKLSKNAPTSIPAIRPTTLPRSKSSTKNETSTATTPVSSPSSPVISSNIFHTSTQFLSNFFGHTQTTGSGANHVEGSSNDNIYGSSDAAMQKSKSSSNVGHIVTRKIWKSRSKNQPVVAAKPQWTPQGNCVWTSSQGHTIKLKESVLYELTEVERKILYQLAIGKINQFNLGVNTDFLLESVTTRGSTQKPAKRKALLLKRKALTTGFFDSSKDDVKAHQGQGRVFGIPLEQSLEYELKDRQESRYGSTKSDRRARNSMSSLMDPNPTTYRCSGSCESLPSKTQQLSDNELLIKGSLSQFDVRRNSHEEEDIQIEGLERSNRPKVPSLIVTCVQHLEKNGIHSVGIFRKSTSKKRVRQLREDFDQGTTHYLDDDVCPHDVATLLKEYLRDLPEPLLCRKLYQPFVNTQKIRNRRLQFEAISYLVQVLPVSHRDTLHYLLKFLAKVARFADDVKSASGSVISEGNKMDSNNLATVFAPNILHNAMPGQVTTDQEVEERLDVINVIRIMIDHYEEMYKISSETIDEIYLNMIDSHPAQLDVLCDRLDSQTNKSQGNDSDASSQLSPTSPPPIQTTAQLLEANKQKRLYAREEFLHQNSSKDHPVRRQQRDIRGQQESTRSASIDLEEVFAGPSRGRRTSSPFSVTNVLTASLKIPVQMMGEEITNIPYIEEDRGDFSSSASGSRRGTAGQVQIDSRKSSSSGTITGTLSLVQSPTTSNYSTSPDHRSVGQVFFGDDDDFKERLMESQVSPVHKGATEKAPNVELRKSSSLFTVGSNKKLFDTKAPTKQKLSIHPSSIMSPTITSQRGGSGGSSEHKMTSISSIGGDLLRSKTADFERFLIAQNNNSIEPRIFKRKEIISSAHNSKK